MALRLWKLTGPLGKPYKLTKWAAAPNTVDIGFEKVDGHLVGLIAKLHKTRDDFLTGEVSLLPGQATVLKTPSAGRSSRGRHRLAPRV